MRFDKYRCYSCKVSFELTWDDDEDAYYSGVEDTDKDLDDHVETHDPSNCPFCGKHLNDDFSDEIDDI